MGINIKFSSRDIQYINCLFCYSIPMREGPSQGLLNSLWICPCFLNSPPPPAHTHLLNMGI